MEYYFLQMSENSEPNLYGPYHKKTSRDELYDKIVYEDGVGYFTYLKLEGINLNIG